MLKVLEDCKNPTKGSTHSAGIDLYAREDVIIGAGETKIVPLGVKIDLDLLSQKLHDGKYSEFKNSTDTHNQTIINSFELFLNSHVLKLYIRSSLAAKHGLIIANGTGIIDMDYNGEIGIIIHKPLSYKDVISLATSACKEFFFSACGRSEFVKKSFSAHNIKAGDKVAQIILEEHKSYLLGIESDNVRDGGYGSTDS